MENPTFQLENAKKKAAEEVAAAYKASVKFIEDPKMSSIEKLTELKKLINKQVQFNKEVVSKANRLKFESEKTFALIKKAKEYKKPEKAKAPPT